jgi:ATP-binding cassette subfamily B protein
VSPSRTVQGEALAPADTANDASLARRAGWRLMRSTARPYWGWVVAGIAAGIVWAVARVSIPRLAGNAIDEGILPHDTSSVVIWTSAILVAGLVQAIATGSRRYTAFRMAHRVETDLRMRLAAHLQRLHFAFHDHSQTGHLMANAQTDVQQVFMVLLLIPLTIASSLTGVLVVVLLLSTNVGLAIFALGALPLLNFSAARFTRRMHPVSLALQDELGQLSGVVEESVTGVRAVKGFGAEKLQIQRLEHEAGDVYGFAMAQARLRASFLPFIDLLPTIGLVGILWWGGRLVINGDLEVGTIVEANTYVLMLIWPLRMLGMLLGQIPRAAASAGRIAGVLSTDPEIKDPAKPVRLPEGPGDVRFEGVRFGYLDGRTVLDGLDLHVRGGEAVALVGATASGKSTVARLLPRFYDVDDGRVSIDGVDVRDIALRDARSAVGIVFEDTFLFSDTVRSNIAFANPDATDEQVERAARLAGAHEFVVDLPAGYDTVIGEQGFSLSGGQRQRVAIARAVLADPRVLVLDDATSAVDPSKEHEIRAAMSEVMVGRTTIIIAHRPATIALADRVVLLEGGRVVAEGTHDELLRTSEHYRHVLARAEADAIEGRHDPEGPHVFAAGSGD